MFAVAESLDNFTKLVVGTALQHRLDGFLEAFGENFAAAGQIGAQALLFGAHLVTSDEERDEANTDDERGNESQTELHSVPLTVRLECGGFLRPRRRGNASCNWPTVARQTNLVLG